MAAKERADDNDSNDSADPLLGGNGSARRLARLDPLSRLAMLGLGTVGVMALLGCCAALWLRAPSKAHCGATLASGPAFDEPSHHTIYLVVGAAGSAISDHQSLLSDRTDMIALCWRERCEDSYAGDVNHPGLQFVYYPNSTWTEGRNRLLRVAQERERRLNRPYIYYTFLDNDFRPAFDPSYPSIAAHLEAHPDARSPRAVWAYYESRLLEYRPALATPFSIQHATPAFDHEDVTMIRYLDARVSSFHRATLDERQLLLPYATDFDSLTWWSSQAVLLWRSYCVYGAVMSVNGVVDAELVGSPSAHGNEHSSYPRGDPWYGPGQRIDDIVPPAIARMPTPRESGPLAPFMPRRADWLAAVPEGCWTRYAGRFRFGGFDD